MQCLQSIQLENKERWLSLLRMLESHFTTKAFAAERVLFGTRTRQGDYEHCYSDKEICNAISCGKFQWEKRYIRQQSGKRLPNLQVQTSSQNFQSLLRNTSMMFAKKKIVNDFQCMSAKFLFILCSLFYIFKITKTMAEVRKKV